MRTLSEVSSSSWPRHEDGSQVVNRTERHTLKVASTRRSDQGRDVCSFLPTLRGDQGLDSMSTITDFDLEGAGVVVVV